MLKSKYCLSSLNAEEILQHACQYAQTQHFNVSIAVMDETGHLLAFRRLDGAMPMTANLSIEKARCSALSAKPSGLFENIIKNGQMGFLTTQSFSGMLEGGEPILVEGQLIGGVGVSGVKSAQDAQIAQIAIQAFLKQHGFAQ